MIVCDIALFICICMLGVALFGYGKRLDLINEEVEDFIAETRELKQRCDTHKKSLEYISKSVRELNGVVEAAVNVKEQTSDNKPDIKALIGGWSTDGTKTNWLDDILAKIRKRKESPVGDTYYLGVGVDDDKMLRIPVRDTGQTLVDGEPIRHGRLWTNSEGRIYELPEGCYISGGASYEMDQ